MKISNETLTALKWLSTINNSIKIEPGHEIFSNSPENYTLAYLSVAEEFDNSFITTNLSGFLSRLSLFSDDFDLTVDDNTVKISNNEKESVFFQSSPNLVSQANRLPKDRDDLALEFMLTKNSLNQILKTCSIMNVKDIKFFTKDKELFCTIFNKEIESMGSTTLNLGTVSENVDEFYIFNKDYLKLPDKFDYNVKIYKGGLSCFTATDSPYKELKVYVVVNVFQPE